MDHDDVLRQRLATQRLTGPLAPDPTSVVRELLCVQAQDAPLARVMIGHRCGAGAAAVAAAVASGELVRTHVLRPTWHYLAAADLRWVLALTSARVESSQAARHRLLRLDPERGFAVLTELLAGRSFHTRKAIGPVLAAAGVFRVDDPLFGQQVGELLLVAELRGLICSAPVADPEHHYALVDEVVPADPGRSRPEAVRELVRRFIGGHGPVSLPDLQRWTPLPLAEIRSALDGLSSVELDGHQLWFDPARVLPEDRPTAGWLLSVFDEAYLSYRHAGFPRSAGHPAGSGPYRFAEAGGGPVVVDLRDVGGWKRKMVRGKPVVQLDLDPGLTARQRKAVAQAQDRLVAAIS